MPVTIDNDAFSIVNVVPTICFVTMTTRFVVRTGSTQDRFRNPNGCAPAADMGEAGAAGSIGVCDRGHRPGPWDEPGERDVRQTRDAEGREAGGESGPLPEE